MSSDTPTPYFDDDQHAADTGRLIGYLTGKGVSIASEMENTVDYTPVVRIEIEGQPPIWVRVQSRS